MRNRLLALLLILLVLIVCIACDTQDKETLEDNVREYLGAPAATFTFVMTDDPAWLDYTYTQYLMVNDGHVYLVGVLHNDTSVHDVDIEAEL